MRRITMATIYGKPLYGSWLYDEHCDIFSKGLSRYNMHVPYGMSEEQVRAYVDSAVRNVQKDLNDMATYKHIYGDKNMTASTRTLTKEFTQFEELVTSAMEMSSDFDYLITQLIEREDFNPYEAGYIDLANAVAAYVADINTTVNKTWFSVTVEPDKIFIKRKVYDTPIAASYGASPKLVDIADITFKAANYPKTSSEVDTFEVTLYRSDRINGWNVKG